MQNFKPSETLKLIQELMTMIVILLITESIKWTSYFTYQRLILSSNLQEKEDDSCMGQ